MSPSSASQSPSPSRAPALLDTPLLVGTVFGYQSDPKQHVSLRRALGSRGGVEGFAAAAMSRQVDHGLQKPDTKGKKTWEPEYLDFTSAGKRPPFQAFTPMCVPATEYVVDADGRLAERLAPVAQHTKQKRGRLPVVAITLRITVGTEPDHLISLPTVLDDKALRLTTIVLRLNGDLNDREMRRSNVTSKPLNLKLLAACCHACSSVDFTNLRGLRRIGDLALKFCSGIKRIDLSTLTDLRSIGNGFMCHCHVLESVSFSGLSKLQSLGDHCLSGCSCLADVNLKSCTALTSLGEQFLAGCTRLLRVDFSDLTAITTIGAAFLAHNTGLRDVDLSAFTKLQRIEASFLGYSTGIESVDLSGLTSVTSVGNSFLAATAIRRLDVSGLRNVKSIRDLFLSQCELLEEVVGFSALTEVTSIGDQCFASCGRLRAIDLSGLASVTSVGHAFMRNCRGLEHVDCTAMTSLATIGDTWLRGCSNVTSVDFSGLSALTAVGPRCLDDCRALKTVNLSGLPGVTTVGERFFWMVPGSADVQMSETTSAAVRAAAEEHAHRMASID